MSNPDSGCMLSVRYCHGYQTSANIEVRDDLLNMPLVDMWKSDVKRLLIIYRRQELISQRIYELIIEILWTFILLQFRN